LRSLGSNILVVPLSACLLGFNVSRKQFLYSLVSSVLFMSATILLFDKYPLLFMFLGSLGSFVGLICNRDAYKGFVRGINRLYPLFCEVIVNLSSKIQKLKKEYIRDEIDNTVESKSAILNNFSLFIFSYYFVFSLYIDNTKSLLPYLIMIGYALVLVFMLREILFPEKLVIKYSNIYYYICLTFCLPLVSSYLLFYYTAFGQESNIWLISSLLTTFLLYQFLNATIFVISMTIGFILGCILYMIEANTTNIGSSLHLILYIYLSFLFISQIIAREKEKKSAQKDKVYKEKLSIIQVFSEMIVHEVKTPISITSMQSCLFQTIIENIEKNQVEEGFIMKRSHYKALKNATFMLEKTSQHGLNTIDNLVTSLKGAVGDNEKQVIFIKDVIEKSIKEYILYIPEIKNIKLKIIDNFKVKYSFNSVKHIIINLIKNSCIHNGYGVTIEVRAENNQLSFKDYGKGIKKEIREKIFEKFFTESKSGTGIGLSFCKIIMHDIGGSIRCESVVGEYTNFILEFPKHHEKNLT
jgi:signal transduction histidine kinase